MTKEAIGAVLLLLGATVVRLSVTGEYLSFVKSSLLVPLLLSAGVLLVLGALELRAWARENRDVDDEGHDETALAEADRAAALMGDDGHLGHHHAGAGPRMGLLLLAPVAVLMLVPAAPLGAFAADNGAANRLPDVQVFPDLPEPVDGAVELVVPDIVGRAMVEPDSIVDVPVRTVGFVAPDPDDAGSYLLSRFTVGCCAVDAAPFQVRVVTGGALVPPVDEWVEAVIVFEGTVEDDDGGKLPVARLIEQQVIEEPDVPYVY